MFWFGCLIRSQPTSNTNQPLDSCKTGRHDAPARPSAGQQAARRLHALAVCPPCLAVHLRGFHLFQPYGRRVSTISPSMYKDIIVSKLKNGWYMTVNRT